MVVSGEKVVHLPQDGFSLIESLIAMALLSFILIGNSAFITLVIHTNAGNRDLALATFLGQHLAETLKARDQAHGDLMVGHHTETVNSNGTVAVGAKFTREWTVSRANSLTTIDITVKWNAKGRSLGSGGKNLGAGGRIADRERKVTLLVVKDFS